jgi:hypothetical protein
VGATNLTMAVNDNAQLRSNTTNAWRVVSRAA